MNTIVILVIIKYLLACEVLMKSDTKKNLRAEISADISYNSCRWYNMTNCKYCSNKLYKLNALSDDNYICLNCLHRYSKLSPSCTTNKLSCDCND